MTDPVERNYLKARRVMLILLIASVGCLVLAIVDDSDARALWILGAFSFFAFAALGATGPFLRREPPTQD